MCVTWQTTRINRNLTLFCNSLLVLDADQYRQRVEWFVSHDGSDDVDDCGKSRDKPCSRLDHVTHVAAKHDVIYIDDIEAFEGDSYQLNCSGSDDGAGGKLLKSLTIVALRGRARIACNPVSASGSLPLHGPGAAVNTRHSSIVGVTKSELDKSSTSERCVVTIDNTTLVDVSLDIDDCRVTVRHSVLVRSVIGTSSRQCRQVTLRVSDSRWYGNRLPCNRRDDAGCDAPEVVADLTAATVGFNVTCAELDAVFDRDEFALGAIRITTNRSMRFKIVNSQFTDSVEDKGNQFLAGLHLNFNAMSAVIELIDTNFTRQVSARADRRPSVAIATFSGHFLKCKLRFVRLHTSDQIWRSQPMNIDSES
jgi:hypothetical protein